MTEPLDPHRALVADAVCAPSSHNTQPWRFRLTDDAIELHADRTRRLPVNDPHDRELIISCGAVLANLVVSAGHHGLTPAVDLQRDDDPDDLATITLTAGELTGDDRLWRAVRTRRTQRKPFLDRAVPEDLLARAVAAADRPAVWTHVLDASHRAAFVDLVATGDHVQFEDPNWRRELAAWLRPRRRGDGLPVPVATGAMTRFMVTHVDLGRRMGKSDATLAATAPAVIVLGTERDDPMSWIETGRALQQLLLTAAAEAYRPATSTSRARSTPFARGSPHSSTVLTRKSCSGSATRPAQSPRRPAGHSAMSSMRPCTSTT